MKILDYLLLCGALSLLIIFKNCDGSNLDISDLLEAEVSSEKPKLLAVEEAISRKNTTSIVEGPSSGSGSSTTSGNGATCSCDNSEAPVCASNGVTYKNSCRFDCTKKRVKRLRVVKNGKCNGVSLAQIRGSRRN